MKAFLPLPRGLVLAGLLAALSCPRPSPIWAAPNADNPPPAATPKEIELGDKASAELEKDPKIKFIVTKDRPAATALVDKLNRIAADLAKVSARPQIKYTVKIIDDKDLNAFTLPNGHIYIYKGLLDYIGSDDEMAAVLAHEIGHNARMHALRGEAKARKLNWVNLVALAAMLGGGANGANIGQFSQLILQGVMNGYGEEFEREADAAAVNEMVATKQYNPSALVTMMDRLTQEEQRHPEVQLGIYRTHPPSAERAAAAMTCILELGLPFTPRDVKGSEQVRAVEDKDRVTVKYDKIVLCDYAVTSGAPTAKARAEQTAQQINTLLRANLQMHEISVQTDAAGPYLVARGVELARVTAADAKLANLAPAALAGKWRDNFRRLFWRETISGPL